MQPSLFPEPGNRVHGIRELLGYVHRIASRVSADAAIDYGGSVGALAGASGNRLSTPLGAQLRCFEVRGCWKKWNPPPTIGASRGTFWVTDAKPVTYLWDTDWHSHWECSENGPVPIFWAVEDDNKCDPWQRVLYPLYGIGQWVWCVFDYEADVWRVIHNYDPIIRFRLIEPMEGCCHARAYVLGYPCVRCRVTCESSSSPLSSSSSLSASPLSSSPIKSSSSPINSSSSPLSSSGCPSGFSSSPSQPASSSSCGSGFIQSSVQSSASSGESAQLSSESPQESSSPLSSSRPSSSPSSSNALCGECLEEAFSRGQVTVYDPNGIVNVSFPTTCRAPACSTGWAIRRADSQRFEVLSYGKCTCGSSSSPLSKPESIFTLRSTTPPLDCDTADLRDVCDRVNAQLNYVNVLNARLDYWDACLQRLCPASSTTSSGEVSSSSLLSSSLPSASSSSASLPSSSSAAPCRLVKDVTCDEDGTLRVEYCDVYLGAGGYCWCVDSGST